jgi:hypothetical protein
MYNIFIILRKMIIGMKNEKSEIQEGKPTHP